LHGGFSKPVAPTGSDRQPFRKEVAKVRPELAGCEPDRDEKTAATIGCRTTASRTPGPFFSRKPEADRTRVSIDQLQVSKFMKEDIIENESADSYYRPFPAPHCPELLGRLTLSESLRQA